MFGNKLHLEMALNAEWKAHETDMAAAVQRQAPHDDQSLAALKVCQAMLILAFQ